MRKTLRNVCVIWFASTPSVVVFGAEDVLSGQLSAQYVSDDNLSRLPTPVADNMLVAAAGVKLAKNISLQSIYASWQASDFKHDKRTDLDAVVQQGKFQISSAWTDRANTVVSWTRSSYLADLLESANKDIVERDTLGGKFVYGTGKWISLFAGAQQINQKHSNENRQTLDYDASEGFVGASYQTRGGSIFSLQVNSGHQDYPNQNVLAPSLNFDYTKVELNGLIVLSPKTKITSVLSTTKRDGIVNTGNGSLVSINADWAATDKLSLNCQYKFNQPAVGEETDSFTEESSVSAGVAYDLTSKIKWVSKALVSERQYDKTISGVNRTETFHTLTPASLEYQFKRDLSFKLSTNYRKNDSPINFRQYTSRDVSLGVYFSY